MHQGDLVRAPLLAVAAAEGGERRDERRESSTEYPARSRTATSAGDGGTRYPDDPALIGFANPRHARPS
jgi:hypothetical protein